MPNHRNYQLINASNYWSNFPTQIFLPFFFFFISASFSPSFDVSCILFIYKNNNFELQISVSKLMALWQLLFFLGKKSNQLHFKPMWALLFVVIIAPETIEYWCERWKATKSSSRSKSSSYWSSSWRLFRSNWFQVWFFD